MDKKEETRLIKLAKERDAVAFERLWMIRSEDVRIFLLDLLSPNDIEEVMQQIATKIWRNMDSFDASKATFKTWAQMIARNTAINHVKKETDAARRSTRYLKERSLTDDTVVRPIFSETGLDDATIERVIREALPERAGQMLAVFGMLADGASNEEIAGFLHTTNGAARTAISRMRQLARNCLAQIGIGPETFSRPLA